MKTTSGARLDRSDIDRVSALVLETTSAVTRELHAGRQQHPAAHLDSALDRDLGLDSLSRVELAARLERTFEVALNEQATFDAATPRDLMRLIVKARAGAPLTVSAVTSADVAASRGAPDQAQTLVEMLSWHVEHNPTRTHIQFYDDYSDGESLSYAELFAGASRVGGALQARGLEPGETVALMLASDRAYFVCFYGVVLAGGIPVPIYPPVRRQQLEDHLRRQSRILDNCRAALLITSADAVPIARLLTASVDSLRHVLDAEAMMSATANVESASPLGSDTAFLQYTSGSTGDPKGVVLSHANLLANVRADGAGMAVTPDDVFVSWLPLYHDMGLIGAWLGSLYHGVKLVIMPPLSFLSRPERWLWAIDRYRGSLSAAPNFAYELCLKRIRDADIAGLDLTRWRIAANGAEAISARTMEAFCRRFADYGFRREAMFPVYGLAECSVGLAFTPLGRGPAIDVIDREALSRRGIAVPREATADERQTISVVACGLPLPGHEIRVVDSAGRELPERQEGRLQFRGPSATSGYFMRPEATATLFSDGWLETGDRAYLAHGELHLTGRIKDVIIRAGRNIYPAELEDAVGELDGIRKGHVAVFGSQDPGSGTERVVVLAETRRRDPRAQEKLRVTINELATDLISAPPDEVVLVSPNTVLRTSSGKIRRAATRTLFEQGHLDGRDRRVWLQVLRLLFSGLLPQARRAARGLGAWSYAAWAWLVFSLLALSAWLLAWLPCAEIRLWRMARTLARVAIRLTGISVELRGSTQLPPEHEACVLVANHQSYLDGIILTALLPRQPRFLIKGELGRSLLLARPLRRLGGIFVERFDAAAGIASMDAAAPALSAGAMLSAFPEGTFKRMPGLLPFHLGAFALAVRHGVALVPLALRGTRSLLRAGSWFPRRGRVELVIGAAVRPQAGEPWAAVMALRDHARAHLLEHCGEPDLAHESNVVDDTL